MNDEFSNFKEEIMKKLSEFDQKSNLKHFNNMKEIDLKFESNSKKLEFISSRVLDVEKIINKDKVQIDHIHGLISFKDSATDDLTTLELKLSSLQVEIKNACCKYDKIYLENLFIPGIIGENNSRFKNMKQFIEVK